MKNIVLMFCIRFFVGNQRVIVQPNYGFSEFPIDVEDTVNAISKELKNSRKALVHSIAPTVDL